ncbi:cytochrome b/b6 domain-containing protein [Sporomusa acidovorans]|uniref:cytochrome b/b6 domain-containing protein n=1 Tax=Sporomusa acidovorans TaxID=112900 RepID=UPI00088A81BC|nr:cytochrome b/b6 domain-containing protein [Sporomusa acidovorans]OZC19075.1 prokaryotic cytochrome b561 [Sporomusa acidovorans DSM 3132]SDD66417.1 Cytochrome b subunit of formate dehydrogenase [Sporomusa acidovorans]
MKLKLEFVLHWLMAITFSILAISGLAMAGARFGWILNYDIATADIVHRVTAVIYVIVTLASIGQEVMRVLRSDSKKDLPWSIFGRSGYGFFTLVTTLLFILTGVILWKSHHSNMAAVAFAMFVHENLTYIVLASLVWHMYQKAHGLLWPKQAVANNLMTQRWFKLVVWFITSSFFFAVAAIMVSFAGPPPGGQQIKAYMAGMMQAMDKSLMGLANMEPGLTVAGQVTGVLPMSASMLVILLILAFLLAIGFLWEGQQKNER